MKLVKTILIGSALAALLVLNAAAVDIDKIKFPKLNPVEIPQVERVKLDNGMTLYLLEDHSLPLFNMSARLNVGQYLDPADKIGLAALCGEVMRTGGTEKWSGDEINAALEAVGGSIEVGFDITEGSAGGRVLSEYTDLGLEVLAEVLRRPVFAEDKLELSKVQARTGISRRNDDPSNISRREWQKRIYGAESVYGRHEEYATIDNISRDDLVAFHQQWIRPENVQLAIWGDFVRDDVVARVTSLFGDWERGSTPVPALPAVNYDWRSKVYLIEKADAEQSYIRIGHLSGMMNDPDYPTLVVMNSILGGDFGSRITDKVRTEMGLAYTTYGNYLSFLSHPGYFFAYASTKPETTVKATKAMIEQIKSMQEIPPTPVEMRKGKDGYLNSFVFNFDSKGEVINRMMTYDFFGLPENYLQTEKEAIEKVTPEAVLDVARRKLKPDQMIIQVVGNSAAFVEPLTELGLGEPELIDITIPSGEKKSELTVTPEMLEKGRELINEATTFFGGGDLLAKVKTSQTAGTLTLVTPNGELPITFEHVNEYPDRIALHLSMMGQKMVNIRNGSAGWKTDQTGSIVPMNDDDIREAENDLLRDPLYVLQNFSSLKLQPVFDGTGDMEGTAVAFVVLLDPEGQKIGRWGIAEGGMLVSNEYWGPTLFGEGNVLDLFGEYVATDGIKQAHSSVKKLNGQTIVRIQLTSSAVNVTPPAGAFDKPTM